MSRQVSINLEQKNSQEKLNGAEENPNKLEIYTFLFT